MKPLLQLLMIVAIASVSCHIGSAQEMPGVQALALRVDSVEYSPAATANAYMPGTNITIRARFIASGLTADTTINVNWTVRRTGPALKQGTTPLAFEAPDDTVWATLTTVADTQTTTAGQYTVQIVSNPPGLLNFTSRFYIRAAHDVATLQFLQPAQLAHDEGATVPVVVRFINLGQNTERDVKITVYSTQPGLYADSTIVTGDWEPLTFRDITFKDLSMPVAGSYALRACALSDSDNVAQNNCSAVLQVTARRNADLAVVPLAQGGHYPPPEALISADDSFAIRVPVTNAGPNPAGNVRVSAIIYTLANQIMYTDDTVLTVVPGDNSTLIAVLPRAGKLAIARYRLAVTVGGFDRNAANDTLSWYFQSVRYTNLSGIDVTRGYHQPAPGSTLQRGVPVPVEVSVMNVGRFDVDSVQMKVEIRNPVGRVVYTESRTIVGLPKDSVIITQTMPSFRPDTNGQHCAMAWISHQFDTLKSDDTARWCFTVQGSSSVDEHKRALRAGYSLSVQPNPSSGKVTLGYRTPDGVRWRAVLYDVSGRQARLFCDDCGGGEGNMEIVLEDLPSGRYMMTLESSTGERLSEPVMIRK